mgnify:CR=1 FL=1
MFGNCYTFNSGIGKNTDELLWAYKSGRQYGNVLTVELQLSAIENHESRLSIFRGSAGPEPLRISQNLVMADLTVKSKVLLCLVEGVWSLLTGLLLRL